MLTSHDLFFETIGALSGALWGEDGLHQQVIDVGLAFINPFGLSDIHWPLS